MTDTLDRHRGLYSKYEVKRTDGSSEPGGKHAECAHFVLDVDHDVHALPALYRYARSCRDEYPELAADLIELASRSIDPVGGPETYLFSDAAYRENPIKSFAAELGPWHDYNFPGWRYEADHKVMGIAEEIGELLEALNTHDPAKDFRAAVIDAIGDVQVYLAGLMLCHGVSEGALVTFFAGTRHPLEVKDSGQLAAAFASIEASKIVHAQLKLSQGIRGAREQHVANMGKHAETMMMQLQAVALAHGTTTQECLTVAWSEVRKRDWRKKVDPEEARRKKVEVLEEQNEKLWRLLSEHRASWNLLMVHTLGHDAQLDGKEPPHVEVIKRIGRGFTESPVERRATWTQGQCCECGKLTRDGIGTIYRCESCSHARAARDD